MKKAIIPGILAMLVIIPGIPAFDEQVIDPNEIRGEPAIAIHESTGKVCLVWSRHYDIVYACSDDNYTINLIDDDLPLYTHPDAQFDSSGNLHIAYSAYVHSDIDDHTFYYNTLDQQVIDLEIGYSQDDVDLEIVNDEIYIASVDYRGTGNTDIAILYSDDYENFTVTYIEKELRQKQPIIEHCNGTIDLIYYDWSDGTSGGAGLYKIRYRSSSDNYATEQTISPAQQSYDPDMVHDSSCNLWVSYKDTTETEEEMEFNYGILWLADKNSGWSRTQLTDMILYQQNRPPALSITQGDVLHLAWTEWTRHSTRDYDTVELKYANTLNLTDQVVSDTTAEDGLGHVDMTDDEQYVYIAANMHSLLLYSERPYADPIDPVQNIAIKKYKKPPVR